MTIIPGGPAKNNRLLLAAGRADFYMGDTLIGEFSALAENVPIVYGRLRFSRRIRWSSCPIRARALTVSSICPGRQGLRRAGDAHHRLAVDGEKWGFFAQKVATYNFNSCAFHRRRKVDRAGLSDLGALRHRPLGRFQPNVFLLADHGYETYATTIETRRAPAGEEP